MLYFFAKISFTLIIAIFSSCIICDVLDDENTQEFLNDFIPKLYLRYRKVLDHNEDTITFRRLFKNNKEYNIHIHKLKDVNGFKRHNLIIKEESDDNPLIYVNNPVETKIPNAYLTLDEFKEVLNDRILRQRNDFDKKQLKTSTFKNMLHLTTKQIAAVPSSNSKNNPTTVRPRVNVSKNKRNSSKIISKIKKTTSTTDQNKYLQNKYTVVGSSQSIFANKPISKAETVSSNVIEEITKNTKLVTKLNTMATKAIEKPTKNIPPVSKVKPVPINTIEKTKNYTKPVFIAENVSTNTIEETTRNTPVLLFNVSVHTVLPTIRKLIKNDSTTTNKHNILRLNDKETPAKTTNADSDFNAKKENTTAQEITKQLFSIENELSAIADSSTEKLSTGNPTTTKESTTKISSEESISKESTMDKSTHEEPSTESSTTGKPTEELNTQEPTTEQSTNEEPTTEESTTKTSAATVKITTKSKRVTLARPLVYMGGWDN